MSGARRRLFEPGGVLALIRLAAVPVFFAAERLVDHPVANTDPFGELLALAGVYAVLAFAAQLAGRAVAPARVLAALDLLLIFALIATSGGPFSQLRYALFMLPIGAALLLRPAFTALVSAICLVLYGLAVLSFPDPEGVRSDAIGFEVTQALFLAWMGTAATLLSSVLTRRAAEITALADSRGRLVAEALGAEDAARKRVAEALHDDALQNLLAARQLLDAPDPDSVALAREGLEEGVGQIRDVVFDLHPYLLEQSGLRAALQAVAEKAGRRAGFAVSVAVEEAAEGGRDHLLFSIGRELVANAAKHSRAEHLDVRVRALGGGGSDEDALELVVTDDGQGFDPSRVRAAHREGHIGLASCTERAEAVGGTLTISRGPAARGTSVRVVVPRG